MRLSEKKMRHSNVFVRSVCKLTFLCLFLFCRLAKKKERNEDKNAQTVKNLKENPEAVKWISDKRTIVYCRCTCHRHTLVFGIIGAREKDRLPKAFIAELLVAKQDPNSRDRVG